MAGPAMRTPGTTGRMAGDIGRLEGETIADPRAVLAMFRAIDAAGQGDLGRDLAEAQALQQRGLSDLLRREFRIDHHVGVLGARGQLPGQTFGIEAREAEERASEGRAVEVLAQQAWHGHGRTSGGGRPMLSATT